MDSGVNPLNRRHTFAGYSRHFWSARVPRDRHNELVWVNRWYTPEDLRSSTPVQRHKFLSQPLPSPGSLPLTGSPSRKHLSSPSPGPQRRLASTPLPPPPAASSGPRSARCCHPGDIASGISHPSGAQDCPNRPRGLSGNPNASPTSTAQ